jgi:hypothetical protein
MVRPVLFFMRTSFSSIEETPSLHLQGIRGDVKERVPQYDNDNKIALRFS